MPRLHRVYVSCGVLALLHLAAVSIAASPGGAASPPNYASVDPVTLSSHLADVLATPEAALAEYWRSKPPLVETYYYPLKSEVTAGDLEAARRLREGEFSPYPAFPWQKLGVPPAWDTQPVASKTWDSYRQELYWLAPLIRAYAGKSDLESLRLAQQVFADWIAHNSRPPYPSKYMWLDATVGKRLRIMCWFWEIWRKSPAFDPGFAQVFLASVYQHALYLSDPKEYVQESNHGLDMDAGLLAAAVTFPEFREANAWRECALQRMAEYIARNFSPEGFHLEQSPSYHWLAMTRLAETVGFLRANRQEPRPALTQGLDRALAAWPYLLRPDHRVPLVGDSEYRQIHPWRALVGAAMKAPVPAAAAPTLPNPRSDSSGFQLSFPAGYAVFTAYDPGEDNPKPDTHVLFKCNSFRFPHFHFDALSFTLYGLGRDWIVDCGKLNYEDIPERLYLLSSRAHNVVLVDGADFQINPIKLVDHGRASLGDYVTARHELPRAHHTRTLRFLYPSSMWLTDTAESTDGRPHTYSQLFQVAPGLQVKQLTPGRMALVAPNGDSCVIDQVAPVGEWKIITGQKEPFLQGWYSPAFNQLEPISTLFYTTVQPVKNCTFVTRLSLESRELPSTAPVSPVAVFFDPLEQYQSRWNRRTKVVLQRQGQGVRCDIIGTADVSGTQYGGIRFPTPGMSALKLDLSFLNRKGVATLYVDGYDASGARVARWTRRISRTSPLPARTDLTLRPGKKSDGFVPEGQANLAVVREVEVFMLISPKARNGFVLNRAESVR